MTSTIRQFPTGANRSSEEGKLDYEGFLSPAALKCFAEYMHRCRHLPDGTMRESDNWQKGIPQSVYMKSMWRHFMEVWRLNREPPPTSWGPDDAEALIENLCALLFNVQGMLHEVEKRRG